MSSCPTLAGALLVAAGGVLFALLESPFDPVVWQNPTALPALEGTLSADDRLLATEHLHEGVVVAPEAFAEGDDGSLYTGSADGMVYRLDPDGENPEVVFFTGGVVSAAGKAVKSTTGIDYSSRLMLECQEKAAAKELKLDDERRCGRPLGVKFRGGKLYILDAYHGLFVLDVNRKGRGNKHLINSLTDSPRPLGGAAGAAAEATLPLTFLNDFDFTDDGTIFLSDSSWKYPRAHNRRDIVDGAPNGRLLRFDPATGDLRTVMCGLHFPNGVLVDPSRTKLLLVESLRFRVLELDIKALSSDAAHLMDSLTYCGEEDALPGGVRVFAKALPGFVDNLEFDEKLGGYVAGAGTKVAAPFSALHLALKAPGFFRTVVGKFVPIHALEKVIPR